MAARRLRPWPRCGRRWRPDRLARHVIAAGCDGAVLCGFDPVAFPDDFDATLADDPMGRMAALQAAQRCWTTETGGDGDYLIDVRVDEPPIRRRAGVRRTLVAEFAAFACPGGRLWLCGAEYAARDPVAGSANTPTGGLGAYPHMGASVALPPGRHRMTVWRLAWSDTTASRIPTRPLARVAVGMMACGGIIALSMTLALVLGLLAKAAQAIGLSGPTSWRGIEVVAALAGVGAALAGAGSWLYARQRDTAGGRADAEAAAARRVAQPDYLVEIQTGATTPAAPVLHGTI